MEPLKLVNVCQDNKILEERNRKQKEKIHTLKEIIGELEEEIYVLEERYMMDMCEMKLQIQEKELRESYFVDDICESRQKMEKQKIEIDKLNKKLNEQREQLRTHTNEYVNCEKLNQKLVCVVCGENPTTMLGKDCKHLSCCLEFSIQLKTCPICRNPSRFEKIYFA